MVETKPLSKDAIPRALEKAERYRLLNEPAEAESICLDILGADPDHQQALVTLLLALTDQFDEEGGEAVTRARAILPRLRDEYSRAYYAGIVSERRAKALLRHGEPGTSAVACQGLREAMSFFERAESLRPPGNDDALLRWNACARLLARHPELAASPEERTEPPLE
jgi:hypothetical protein